MRKQIIHRRALGIGDADDDIVLLLAQVSCDAGNGPARTDRADEAVYLASCLLPDLRTSRNVMRLAIVQIVPLIGK